MLIVKYPNHLKGVVYMIGEIIGGIVVYNVVKEILGYHASDGNTYWYKESRSDYASRRAMKHSTPYRASNGKYYSHRETPAEYRRRKYGI